MSASPCTTQPSRSRDLASRMYKQHHAELYRSALRACRDPQTADDLVQEAFLRLVIEIDADRAPDNVRAWLHRVIANLAVSLGRRAAVGRRFAGAVARGEDPVTPEAVVVDAELRSDLALALRTLPDGARTALVLAANGFTGAEIAAAIGKTDCATRTLICRARLKLRDRLADVAVERRADALPAFVVRPAGPAPSASAHQAR